MLASGAGTGSHLPSTGAVGVKDEDLVPSAAKTIKRDPGAVRRPGGILIEDTMRELSQSTPVDVDDEQIVAAVNGTIERDLGPIRRPRRHRIDDRMVRPRIARDPHRV